MSGFALSALTEKPVLAKYLENDDFQLGRGALGTIAKWDIQSKEDCYKAHFVFFVKKLFHFLDWVGVGQYAFGSGGFEGRLSRCITYQIGLERNALAREKIINALGGREECAKIQTLDPDKLCDAFLLKARVVQSEDREGRKFVVFFLADKRGNYFSATAKQYCHVTCVKDRDYDGRHWTLNINHPDHVSCDIGLSEDSTDKVAKFIEDVIKGKHEKFSIAHNR